MTGRRDAGSPPPSPHRSLSLLSGRQQRRTRLCEPDPEATGRTSGGLLRFITQPKQQEPHLFWLAVNGSHPARHRCLVPSRRAQIAPTFSLSKWHFYFATNLASTKHRLTQVVAAPNDKAQRLKSTLDCSAQFASKSLNLFARPNAKSARSLPPCEY